MVMSTWVRILEMVRGGSFVPDVVLPQLAELHDSLHYPDLWDDLRFPATGFNPAGSTAPPDISRSTGLLLFSGTANNVIAGIAQMPHSWKEGSPVYPHIHVRFPTAATANTRWSIAYDVANPDGLFTNDSGTYTALSTVTVPNANNTKRHVRGQFGLLDMTGMRISACIVWRLTRLASSDAADNDTSDCEFMELDFHYQMDSGGSVTQAAK